MTAKMVDVSQYQGTIDWAKVKQAVDMAIIRCGYRGYGAAGNMADDPMFKRNIDSAMAEGVPVGVYWCSQALSDAEAIEEARYCKMLLHGHQLALPVFLDSEHMGPGGTGRADKINKTRRTQYGLTFLRAMRDYGYTTGLYCSESWYTDDLDGPAFRADGHDIWIAKYSVNAPKVDGIAAWQYTSTGAVPGIAGNVDLNHVYKDYLHKEPMNFREEVKKRFGLDDYTMEFLGAYRFGNELLEKLATRG